MKSIILGLAVFVLVSCATVDVKREDIKDGSKLGVLVNVNNDVNVYKIGSTVFEGRDNKVLSLPGGNISEKVYESISNLVAEDSKFTVAPMKNQDAAKFLTHTSAAATEWGKGKEQIQTRINYCRDNSLNYLLLVQPKTNWSLMATDYSRRGTSFIHKTAYGSKQETYLSIPIEVILYDCVTGYEIDSAAEYFVREEDKSNWIDINDKDYVSMFNRRIKGVDNKIVSIANSLVLKISVFGSSN